MAVGGVTRRAWTTLGALLALTGLGVMGPVVPAWAAHVRHAGGRGGPGTPVPSPQVGNDVSYPQCGARLPSAPAFGIVGVDAGRANARNPCLGPSPADPSYAQSELYWAEASATGDGSQPAASLYVNTADPGNVSGGTPVGDWPTAGATPYGPCATTAVTLGHKTSKVGDDSPACAWRYGYDRAVQDVRWVADAALGLDAQAPPVTVLGTAAGFPWWLDVETGNTWQSGPAGIAMNVADLQGMVAALRGAGAALVGVYSTPGQWGQIAGSTTASSGSLFQLPVWLPGATSRAGAAARCASPSFTGGRVALAQWTAAVDDDLVC